MDSTLLKIIGLGFTIESNQVLKNINIEVNRGEIFAIMGPSGAGKTTLLRILNLLERPATGSIIFEKDELVNNSNRTRISMVFQTPALFNDSVYNNIAYGLKVRKIKKDIIDGKVKQSLKLVGLEGYEKRNTKTLSGGEAQRIAFARAVVFGPELLLLDEPTANLDPTNVAKIEEIIRIINKKTTIIIASHNMNQVRRLADRVGMLLQGELIESNSKDMIFSDPADERTRAFIDGAMIY